MAKIALHALVWIMAMIVGYCIPTGHADYGGGIMPDGDFTDFRNLQRPDSPNTWLIAPDGFGRSKADALAPVFGVSPETLAGAWIAVVEHQPRTQVLGVSRDGLGIEAQQRTAVFGFVDRISGRIIPLGAERATIAVYSRSLVGWWDLGVNRARLRRWIDALSARVEQIHSVPSEIN